MTEGEDQFLGNGYDSDLMTDFIIRSPQPQNSSSLPEPRENHPLPKIFLISLLTVVLCFIFL